MKKFLAMAMAVTMLGSMATMAYAASPRIITGVQVTETSKVDTSGGTGSAKVNLVAVNDDYVSGNVFSAIIPAVIPLSMDVSGAVTAPTNATIKNMNIDKAIKVSSIQLTGASGWSVVDYATGDVSVENGKNIAFQVNGSGTDSTGMITTSGSSWEIGAAENLELALAVKASKQSTPGNKGQVANMAFTLDWAVN